jgi:signal transduction histidine kinase/ActR/RegA family two-component response regulator
MARRQSDTRSSAAPSRSRGARVIKRTDAASRRAAQLEAQTEILDLIARGSGLSEILHTIVRVAEEQVAPALCSIVVHVRDGTRPTHIFGSHLPDRLAKALDSVVPSLESGILAGNELHEAALAAGFDDCLTQPIRSRSGNALGSFHLFNRTKSAGDGDRALLDLFGRSAAIAIELDQSTQLLRLADERFTSLTASIPGVVYQRRVAPDGDIRYTYISEGVRDLFGVTPEMVLANPTALFDRHDPTYAANFRERLLAASQSLQLWDVEAAIITNDGQQKYTHAIARPHRQPDGSVLWNGLILDQTRIKKAELAAAAAEASTREAIIESLSQGLVLFDADDRLMICNSSFVKLYPQLRETAAIGAGYERIISAEIECEAASSEAPHDRLRARLAQHGLRHHNLERQLADGRWILVSERRTPDGGTIILHSDISTLKQREEERSKLQDQLFRAQKMEAMGRLAGGVAHDFNNILASILGNAGFLVEDLPPDSEMLEYAKEIVIAGDRAKHLVQQILAFSRQQAAGEADVDTDVVVNEAVQLLRATIPKSIRFDVQRHSSNAIVRGDATQLVQVLMNLCVNARDAIGSQHGSIELEIDVKPGRTALADSSLADFSGRAIGRPDGSTYIATGALVPDKTYLCIRVRDSGCGMEASVLGKMFEPFFTTKEVGKGTGLGLAAVHGIVTSHGGIVACTSKPGSGTMFEIFLPAMAGDGVASKSIAADSKPPGTESILIVDDEQQVSTMLARALNRLGYSVDCFNSASDALDAFTKTPDAWALAITDQTMPQMTGYELVEQILAQRPQFPTILCSGFTDAVTAESASAAGIKAFLTKPVDHEVIARVVRELLDARAA